MKRIYFISGLGANEKAFSKIGDLGQEKVMVKWLENQPKESLKSYAERLIQEYGIKKDEPLVGLSFGGILAQEIATILGSKEAILISGFQQKSSLRLPFR